MNVELLNPFISAAVEVLEQEVSATAQRGEISLQRSAYTTSEVTTMLSIVGEVQGMVLYGMPTNMALALVSQMMGQEFTEFDDLAQSGIGELGNVITGRASTKLSAGGFTANLSPPTLVVGKGLLVSTLDFQRLVIPLATQFGTLEIQLALRENEGGVK